MKRGFFGMVLGVMFLVMIFGLGGSVIAGPKFCPDDQTCYIAIKYNQDGSIKDEACFPEQANLGEGWDWTGKRCGNKKDKPQETEQPAVTSKPADPVTTEQPKNDPQPLESPTVGDNPLNDPEHNSDPVFAVENVQDVTVVPTCDLCALAGTMAAAQSTVASVQSTQNAP